MKVSSIPFSNVLFGEASTRFTIQVYENAIDVRGFDFSEQKENTVNIVGLEAPFFTPNIIKVSAAQTITFENGIFEDEGNRLLLSAIFDPAGEINLVGNADATLGELFDLGFGRGLLPARSVHESAHVGERIRTAAESPLGSGADLSGAGMGEIVQE